MDFPVDFTEKAQLPASAGGSGYPFKISANDLMRNFHYAALDAGDGWIESKKDSLWEGRKLKLPTVPSGGDLSLLSATGGAVGWSQYEEKEVSICEDNYPVTGKVLFKPSE
jgi:hypothetical protein